MMLPLRDIIYDMLLPLFASTLQMMLLPLHTCHIFFIFADYYAIYIIAFHCFFHIGSLDFGARCAVCCSCRYRWATLLPLLIEAWLHAWIRHTDGDFRYAPRAAPHFHAIVMPDLRYGCLHFRCHADACRYDNTPARHDFRFLSAPMPLGVYATTSSFRCRHADAADYYHTHITPMPPRHGHYTPLRAIFRHYATPYICCLPQTLHYC